jgi:hypothetical protein
MKEKALEIVIFHDILEDNADAHFGILFESGFILCLCCGGCVEPDDYDIIEHLGWKYIDQTLLENY